MGERTTITKGEFFKRGSNSPIEELFVRAFFDYLEHSPWEIFSAYPNLPRCACAAVWHLNDSEILLASQVQIERYRVDYLIQIKRGHRAGPPIIVECDGHDFHNVTKEQAQRDRERDRDLQSQGFRVLRFTGSELFRHADSKAEEAILIAETITDDALDAGVTP